MPLFALLCTFVFSFLATRCAASDPPPQLKGNRPLHCQTLVKIYNAGTVSPGNANSTGILVIKAHNAHAADQLVVDQNEVLLEGRLIILDNTHSSIPISGSFSSFESNLPSHLRATVQYDPSQIKIRIL